MLKPRLHRIRLFALLAIACGLALWCSPAAAEVVRFEIASREPFAEGTAFGDAGPYERIIGRVLHAIDPAGPRESEIVDLRFAPRNARGLVEFSADLFILAPKDLAKGNGALLYDVNNRGNKLALRFFNDGPGGNDPRSEADAGNGFLLRRGFVIVWSGWLGDVLPGGGRLRLRAPTARGSEGPITGRVRYEILPKERGTRLSVNREQHGAYRPTEEGLRGATLTWRLRPGDPRVPIPREQFRIHVTEPDPPAPDVLPFVEVEIPAGFRKGYIYELIYEARDPLVHGVCFAAVSDLIAALKRGEGESNLLLADGKPAIRYAYGFGVSQSGRFLRELIYRGYAADERGLVFDGLIPHVAGGGLGTFHHRFAQPTAFATQHELADYPTDRFPFAYEVETDPLTGKTDGILRRAAARGQVPFILHTQSSAEYWTRSGSLVHTDPLGERDADPPASVRIYTFGGTQHGPGAWPPSIGMGQAPANPGDYRPLLRALLAALDRWCREGVPAPPSVHPTIRDRTLVPWERGSTAFPAIPGVRYPEVIHTPPVLDLGPRWDAEAIIDNAPPRIAGRYRVLAPACGPDGNDRGCLLPPEVAVPLATFTGWNLRSADAGAENDLVSLDGSYFPFPIRRDDREAIGDPRPSIEERYGTIERYLDALRAYCRDLASRHLLLNEDVDGIVRRQEERARSLFDKIGS